MYSVQLADPTCMRFNCKHNINRTATNYSDFGLVACSVTSHNIKALKLLRIHARERSNFMKSVAGSSF